MATDANRAAGTPKLASFPPSPRRIPHFQTREDRPTSAMQSKQSAPSKANVRPARRGVLASDLSSAAGGNTRPHKLSNNPAEPATATRFPGDLKSQGLAPAYPCLCPREFPAVVFFGAFSNSQS